MTGLRIFQEYKFQGPKHTSRYAFIGDTEAEVAIALANYKHALEVILKTPLTATLTRNGFTNKLSGSSGANSGGTQTLHSTPNKETNHRIPLQKLFKRQYS